MNQEKDKEKDNHHEEEVESRALQEVDEPLENSTEEETQGPKPKMVTITDVEIRQLTKEALEYKDKYLRLLADTENTRKRMQKERQEMTQFAVENLINEFLHPLDNLENALKFADQMSDEVKNWAFGFQMILTQFKDILASNGVSKVDSIGMPFDPHNHEAVEMVETADYQPGTIVEEFIRGYKMGNRTIRPARVKVAKAVQKSNAQETKQNENQSDNLT